jgi:hypothetical protein
MKATRRKEIQEEALRRACSGLSMSNYPAIIGGFVERGIPESEIQHRVNVFTYEAWRALGRQVRRGEKGVKVCTVIECKKSERDETTGEEKQQVFTRPWTTTVFHVSQTDPRNGGNVS